METTNRRSSPFLEALQAKPLICDGAMGTLLYARGVSFEHSFDELNLSRAEMICKVHRDYIKAGANVIETNTFGANRIRLKKHGLEEKTDSINTTGARIARDAREIEGVEVFVAGAVGPLGRRLAPLGRVKPTEARRAFAEQTEALLEGGVDLFIAETFSDLEELVIAVEAIRGCSSLPIVAQMSFAEDGKTIGGNSPEEVSRALSELDVDVIGANCSVGPQRILEALGVMSRHSSLPLSAQPNAGMPQLVDGRFVYFSSPDYFATYAARFLALRVRLMGGCCGTTPAHIAAMAKSVAAAREAGSPPEVSPEVELTAEEAPEPAEGKEESTPFAEALGKRFVISVELDPPRGSNPGKALKGTKLLKEAGVDAVNIADSPMARSRMSCIALAVLVREKVGIDTVLHMTCRDRNLLGLQSDLIGVNALGIRNLLIITGDPPALGDYPSATGVYDVDSIGLMRIVSRLNEGLDHAGNSIGNPTALFAGVAVNPVAEDMEIEIERFKRKIDAGARFAFTQPIYRLSSIERFLERVSPFSPPILIGVLPLMSHRHAEFLHNEVPGITIPDEIRERIRRAGEKAAEEGIRISLEILEKAGSAVSGAYLMPSFGRYNTCLEIVKNFRS